MKKQLTLATLMILLTLGLVAQPSPNRGHDRSKHRPEADKLIKCLSVIDLSEEQKTQVRGILEASRAEIQVLMEEGRALHEALQAASETGDACSVGTAFLNVQSHREEIEALRESIREDISALLSPEQQAKLAGCLRAPGRGLD